MEHKELCAWFNGKECDCRAELVNTLVEASDFLVDFLTKHDVVKKSYKAAVDIRVRQVQEAINKAKEK